jgi:N6-L-threonylcarbamoyladenine synthase
VGIFLGIDTSNYTTSAAIYNTQSGEILQQRKLLEVKSGEKGLRQSDALFQHVKTLPVLLENLLSGEKLDAVGFSARPRDVKGSYMPCFLAGEGTARGIAAALSVPCYDFSHQAGHIAAALFSIGKLSMLNTAFIAFHVSGGTTDVLLCSPQDDAAFKVEQLAYSLDLKAGQAVDRVGLMLGLDFPAGPRLETLALQSNRQFMIKPCLKGCDCCLSGIENICAQMIKRGEPSCDVARFCLEFIKCTLDGMASAVLDKLGKKLPLVFAGGVMSNSIIRRYMSEKYDADFAASGFSSDNAAGIAALAAIKLEGL